MHTLEQLKTGQLNAIKRLQIAEDLTEFPVEIFELADSLEILDLSNNQLDSLPTDFHRLHQLKILFLSNNRFESLPPVLASCPKLEMIGFKANRIKSLGEDVLPKQTRWLILTDNQLETLPDSMGQLYRLQKLALAGNRLRELPGSMEQCKNLELVRLSANQLSGLPDWLLRLPKLAWLAFAGNPLASDSASENNSVINVKMADFTLGEQLGEGASGVIYSAKWTNQPASLQGTDPYIAVKLFKGEVTSDGYPLDELNNCLMVGEHSNLIKVVAQISEKDQLGLVMALIPDSYRNLGLPPSLVTCTRDTFQEGTSYHLAEIAQIALGMADTLAHLHLKGVSHGDVYAHNTMIDDKASILFGDFGAASDLSSLPDLQKEAMEAIEIRAFACMLEDLLALSDEDTDPQLASALVQLKDSCLQDAMALRPRFGVIKEALEALVV